MCVSSATPAAILQQNDCRLKLFILGRLLIGTFIGNEYDTEHTLRYCMQKCMEQIVCRVK